MKKKIIIVFGKMLIVVLDSISGGLEKINAKIKNRIESKRLLELARGYTWANEILQDCKNEEEFEQAVEHICALACGVHAEKSNFDRGAMEAVRHGQYGNSVSGK